MKHPQFKQYSNEELRKMQETFRRWKHYATGGVLKLDQDEVTIEELNEEIKKITEELDDRYSKLKLRLIRLK